MEYKNIDTLFTSIEDNGSEEICSLDGREFIRLKDNITSRVTYSKQMHSFCFWFMPDEQNTSTFYEIKMELEKHPAEVMLNAMYKLSTKKWYGIEVQQDFLALFRSIIGEEQWSDISSVTE